jgi:hypothetical protein
MVGEVGLTAHDLVDHLLTDQGFDLLPQLALLVRKLLILRRGLPVGIEALFVKTF